MNNTASTQGDTISRSALLYAFNKWLGCDDIPAAIVADIIEDAPAVEPQMPREYRQALETLNYIKERYILVEKSPTDDPSELLVGKVANKENIKKDSQPERNCEKCEHYKQKTEGVPGDGLYGCELWDCIYERGQQNVK